MFLLGSATVEYTYLICVTVNGHTTCSNKVVQSFEIQIYLSGVLTIIISIGIMLVYTVVIIIISIIKHKKNLKKLDLNPDFHNPDFHK